MPRDWFVADEHYNDNKMVGTGRRPFEIQAEMIEGFREAHNRVVAPGERVFHVGDFFLESGGLGSDWPAHIVAGLNGRHFLVRGNHDHPEKWTPNPFEWVRYKSSTNIVVAGERIHVCLDHMPGRAWDRKHHGAFQLHGHEHSTMPPLVNQLDVGIINARKILGEYRPFSDEEVVQIVREAAKTPSNHPDNFHNHHGPPPEPVRHHVLADGPA